MKFPIQQKSSGAIQPLISLLPTRPFRKEQSPTLSTRINLENRSCDVLNTRSHIEVISHEDLAIIELHGPRISEITRPAIVPQDYLRRRGIVGALRIENTSADSQGRVPVSVG